MTEFKHAVDVGVADPELNTSPIADEGDEETEVLRQEMPGEPVCYFNNKSFFVFTFPLLFNCATYIPETTLTP
jgi:hypothetical protein